MTNYIRVFAIGSLMAVACGDNAAPTEPGGDCAGGKCDEASGTVSISCLEDHTGRGQDAFELGDAVAKLVFADGECEQGFEDTVAALTDSGKCSNHRTMAVSEVAQRIGAKPPFFRTVTALDCELGESADGDTLIGGVWFSLFAEPDAGPGSFDSAEVIAFDPVNGIFNYYDTSAAEIQFFGDSFQFIQDKRPAEQAAGSNTARCAGCHRGGGLIMKELPAPWMHWEPDFTSPGHDELIEANEASMGRPSDGIDLETGVVRPNNRTWNQSRISKVVAGLGTTTDTKLLLRPLFCAEDINLAENFGDSVSSGPLGGGVIVDRKIASFGSVSISSDDYRLAKKKFRQRMASGLNADDTVGALARVFRADSDIDYQEKLRGVTITKPDGSTEKIEIVDTEFIEDVLMVDFTRALQLSGDDRCALLEFAPDLRADQLSPKAIRDGFIDNLEGASSKAAQDFRKYLLDNDDDPKATVKNFENACNNRKDKKQVDGESVSGVALDYLTVIFHNRNRAEDRPVFEFDGQTMPQTNAIAEGTRLDPNTCELVTDYVSPNVVTTGDPDPDRGGGGDDEPVTSCKNRCGEFSEAEGACNCDAKCVENGDCCGDFGDLCEDVTGSLSCKDRCGESNPDFTCQCDFDCDDDGDCCQDWGAECMDPTNIDPGPAPDPKLSCKADGGGDRCDTFNPGANCQCNAACVDIGDCCPDFSLVCGGGGDDPPPAGENCIHIAEVFYDAVGGDDGAEWVKLYNSCDSEQSTKGMSLGYGGSNYTTGQLDLQDDVPAKGCLIIGGPASGDDNGTPAIDIKVNFRPDLQNSGSEADGLALFNAVADDVTNASVPVDAVIYGGSNSSDLVDESGEVGEPDVGDAPEGQSIRRTGRNSWEIGEPDPRSCPDF